MVEQSSATAPPDSAVVFFHADWAAPSVNFAPIARSVAESRIVTRLVIVDQSGTDAEAVEEANRQISKACLNNVVPELIALRAVAEVDRLKGAKPRDRVLQLFLASSTDAGHAP